MQDVGKEDAPIENLEPGDVLIEKVDTPATEVNIPDITPSSAAETDVKRSRSYSHLNRRVDSLDSIEVNGTEYIIPATMGSNYWSILRVMYTNINQPVLFDELTDGVEEVMREHDEKSWEYFCNKQQTTVWKRLEGRREIKSIKSWQERIIGNAKTLCRWKDYGKRLFERGHVMRLEYDEKSGEPYFILYDNLNCLNTKKKTKKENKDAAEQTA